MTPEQRLFAFKAAVAEAGFPDAVVTIDETGWPEWTAMPSEDEFASSFACWTAFRLLGCPVTPECFFCWEDGTEICEHS